MHREYYLMRFKKNSVEPFYTEIQKSVKSQNLEESCNYRGGEITGWFSGWQERKYAKISKQQNMILKNFLMLLNT